MIFQRAAEGGSPYNRDKKYITKKSACSLFMINYVSSKNFPISVIYPAFKYKKQKKYPPCKSGNDTYRNLIRKDKRSAKCIA